MCRVSGSARCGPKTESEEKNLTDTDIERAGISILLEKDKPIDRLKIAAALKELQKYKDGKRNLERRIREEERWWSLRH